MAAPAVAPTGAAQVAEPMIIIEPEKKSAEKRSHDNLNDPEIDAAAKRGALAQLQPSAVCRGMVDLLLKRGPCADYPWLY
jgi:hypothetical protein